MSAATKTACILGLCIAACGAIAATYPFRGSGAVTPAASGQVTVGSIDFKRPRDWHAVPASAAPSAKKSARAGAPVAGYVAYCAGTLKKGACVGAQSMSVVGRSIVGPYGNVASENAARVVLRRLRARAKQRLTGYRANKTRVTTLASGITVAQATFSFVAHGARTAERVAYIYDLTGHAALFVAQGTNDAVTRRGREFATFVDSAVSTQAV